jgi:hypothetical protein
MTIISAYAALVLSSPWGFWASFIIQGAAIVVQTFPPDPASMYQAIYGRIQNQINTAINNKVHNNVMEIFYFL